MNSSAGQSPRASRKKTSELEVLKRAYEREKKRRQYAETMLEDKSRELYLSNEKLSKSNADLVSANIQLEDQTSIISGLSDSYDKVTRELQIAAKVQIDLLPQQLTVKSITAHGIFKPAEFIAGDGYDFFLLEDNLFAFYAIDVAGHGIAAAMVSFAVQIHLNPKVQGICQQSVNATNSLHDAVANTLYSLNKSFYLDDNLSHYFTMIYGIVDLKTGQVAFGQAGHPAPMLFDAEKKTISEHGNGGNPVAMFANPVFDINQCQMHCGDRLVVYSDGISECPSKDGEEFGATRLASKIIEFAPLKIERASERIAESLVAWHGADIFDDDLSLLHLEYTGANS